jgi:hypothetical protein
VIKRPHWNRVGEAMVFDEYAQAANY